MDAVPGWKLKKVGDFVDLRERTNKAGTQLLAGQAEAQIRVDSQTKSPG